MSARKAIRHKIIERLMDKTRAEDRVFSNPARNVWQESLPAILVYSRAEQVEDFSSAPRELRRRLRITVEALAALDENLDDELDDLTDEIEQALGADETLNGLCSDMVLEEIAMQLQGDGNTAIGTASMTYVVTYFSELVDNSEIVPLEGIDVAYDLKPSEIVEARDEIDLPQD